ncbi:hypothetical protein ccbrp13_04950 [Ktedonobacteria bacterium brp13]|nr:hypothetical protein ccbrp13_04950 [Ktedonobacteria bacterium brp13]
MISTDVSASIDKLMRSTVKPDEWGTQHELAYNGEESFFFARDRDIEVRFENPDAQGRYTRIRVVRPFSWNTAERTAM